MKKYVIIMIFSSFFSMGHSQLSLLVGGGVNMTTDNIKGFHKSNDDSNQLSITPDVGGFGEIGCSYAFKKHYLLKTSINFAYQEYNTITKTPYTSFVGYKTMIYDNFYDFFYSVSLPITFGYVIGKDYRNFSFIPHIGWVNQLIFNSQSFNISNAYPGRYYIGAIQAGLLFRFRFLYLSFDYAYSLTKSPILYQRVSLQTVNLTIGYVYTFKKKEKHPK